MRSDTDTTRNPRKQDRDLANAIICMQLEHLISTVRRLDTDGHQVICVTCDSRKPTVILSASARLAAMATDGHGSYYMLGHDEQGPYRDGVLIDYPDVQVRWKERGPR